MATPQEKPNETRPLRDDVNGNGGGGYGQEFEEPTISCYGCACVPGLFWWRLNGDVGHGYVLHQQQQQGEEGGVMMRESWLKRNAKKLKEMSEVWAGPRWKNFIRRLSKRRSASASMQFQYDPRSYELNFDQGIYREVDDGLYPDFTARFAAPPAIHKG